MSFDTILEQIIALRAGRPSMMRPSVLTTRRRS
jgi:hypothetical protein